MMTTNKGKRVLVMMVAVISLLLIFTSTLFGAHTMWGIEKKNPLRDNQVDVKASKS